MTDEELKALVASLAISQQETDKQLKALSQSQQQTDKQLKERGEQTDKQLKALSEQTDKQLKALSESQQETDRQLKELGKQTDRQLKELTIQIGGLGNKFGGFTEGLALPSMSKVLREHFKTDIVLPRAKSYLNGHVKELDVLAYSNKGLNEAYIVEVKSLLNQEGLKQILKTLEEFPKFFPEHQSKALYGILAYVDFREDIISQAQKQGVYLATIHNDLFDLKHAPHFQPKNFRKAR